MARLAKIRFSHAAHDRRHRRRRWRRGRYRAHGALVRARRLTTHVGALRHLDRARHGLARDRGGATAPAHRRACGGHAGRAVGGENRWTRGVHGGVGGRPGHGGDASHQELSPSGRNRSPSSSCSTTCPGAFSLSPWRSEHACWPRWPSFGTTFSAATAGPSAGGETAAASGCRSYSAARSSAASRNRLSSPSRSSTRPRRWNAASVERWPIDTIVVRLSRALSRR